MTLLASNFTVVAESFYKGFFRSFSSKCFQSLGIDPSVILYLLWLTVRKASFLQNIIEEIRPGSRNVQKGPK